MDLRREVFCEREPGRNDSVLGIPAEISQYSNPLKELRGLFIGLRKQFYLLF